MPIDKTTIANPDALHAAIEQRLNELDPAIELILLERPKVGTLRLFVDHPDGVDLGLCERVSSSISELRDDFALEVSSPGLDRPLTKPEHFRRFLGRHARVRTRGPVEGRKNFQGTVTDVDARSVSLDSDAGPIQIPHEEIERSNLVPETPGGSP